MKPQKKPYYCEPTLEVSVVGTKERENLWGFSLPSNCFAMYTCIAMETIIEWLVWDPKLLYHLIFFTTELICHLVVMWPISILILDNIICQERFETTIAFYNSLVLGSIKGVPISDKHH